MEIRKLESAEHGKTRFLWEKIFKEDWKYFQWLSGHVNLKQK